ncbi:sodium transport system permease protein [Rheinheimera pacifica]|uniref:Sodium transport system permease protein n=1 Tax=Rheinheimera pacifica TaxID=173990 RepID=A0A1H6L5E0_9GAMM|nr:ABC transporter permease [Rheinheimera pacifica]SEH81382.1 sodium transport system permease protein [Rheinheimera pacifica]
MWQVYFKELLELVRDKKTLIFVILLPIFIFPMLFGIVGSVMAFTANKAKQQEHRYVIVNKEQAPEFAEALFYHKNFKQMEVSATTEAQLIEAIKQDKIDVAVIIPADNSKKQNQLEQVDWKIIYNQSSQYDFMFNYFNEVLQGYTEDLQKRSLKQLDLDERALPAIIKPVKVVKVDSADKRENVGEKIGAILAYALILLCFSGAAYPAVDIGAGEKERGTLETLLICPISRTALVLGKFMTILTTALLTALITVASLGLWGMVIGGLSKTDAVVDIVQSIAVSDLMLMFLLLLPTSAMFAALLLAISIYARTFKEAQNYISPLTIIVLMPLMVAMAPGIELTASTALVPITNIALAIKELMKGTAELSLICLIFASSVAIAAALIAFCVHWFQQEKVLFR